MSLTLRLKDSQSSLESKAVSAVRRAMDLALRGAAAAVRVRIADLAVGLIERTPEYASLLSGDLLGELGVPHVESRLHEILNAVARGVTVWATPVTSAGGVVRGGLNVGVVRSDYEDILTLAAAKYVSPPSGAEIRWLDWLVTQGDRIVVLGYDVDWDLSAAEQRRSRTGRALMTKGSGWRVPPEFSGSPESNFITRAFDVPSIEVAIARIIEGEVSARLS